MVTDGADVSAETMTKKISKADLIYVDGGNTFYLQRHIIESSFWNIANPFLEKGPCAL
jgi:peptidase E